MTYPPAFLFAVVALLLGGCGLFAAKEATPPPPPPTRVELKIEAAGDINPDAQGQASPVMLRVYELKGDANFNNADFFALYDKEQSALAGDLAHKQEFLLKPGESKDLLIDPQADTEFIGVFAAFRKLDTAQWRVSAPIASHKTTQFVVKIGAAQLRLLAPISK